MPFVSRRQQRFAFATGQPWARRWARETRFPGLPESKDAGTEAGAPAHGPGGLLATPGLGRKWGKRKPGVAMKVMTPSEVGHVAALARWGKYTPKPQTAKPARSRGRRSGGKGKDPAAVARQQQRDQEHAQDRAQRQRDRADRLARQTQRDEERKRDRLQRVGDRATRQMERALRDQERKRQQEERAKKGGGGSGGSGNKKQEQAAREAQRRAERAAALAARRADARRRAQQGEKRDQERRTEQAQRRADQQSREQRRTQQQTTREQARTQAAVQRDTARQQREQEAADRRRVTTPEIADAARRLSAGEQVSEAEQATLIRNGLARRGKDGVLVLTGTGLRASRQKEASSFAVFKDASGELRWIARSTTAYRDRDGEILSIAALVKDADRMTRTGQYGPLRYWHIGQPDPFHETAPWGPGVDLGMCDFSTVIGRTAVESGTFFDEAVGKAFQAAADEYELSPGFFHPYGAQGPPSGVYDDIRRFERSPVPRQYGRASNYYTGLMVKEQRMDPQEIARRVAAFKADMNAKGVGADAIEAALAGVAQSEKSADAQHAVFKSSDAQPVYTAPDGTLGLVVDGQWVALKAAAMPMPPESDAEAKADMPMEDTPMDPAEMSYLGDMDPNEYWGEIDQRLARIEQALNIEDRISKAFGEVKSLLGGYATKDAGRAAEITALKEQQAALDRRLKELEGDQPAVTLPSEIEAALKSSGPQAPDPAAPQIPNDPNRPFAPVVARLAPELYSQEPWNGWPSAGS